MFRQGIRSAFVNFLALGEVDHFHKWPEMNFEKKNEKILDRWLVEQISDRSDKLFENDANKNLLIRSWRSPN